MIELESRSGAILGLIVVLVAVIGTQLLGWG